MATPTIGLKSRISTTKSSWTTPWIEVSMLVISLLWAVEARSNPKTGEKVDQTTRGQATEKKTQAQKEPGSSKKDALARTRAPSSRIHYAPSRSGTWMSGNLLHSDQWRDPAHVMLIEDTLSDSYKHNSYYVPALVEVVRFKGI